MPIPEPSLSRPSNLTKKQRADELAACYGVDKAMPSTVASLTQEEVERMRQIVLAADAERQPFQTIDLNNPPRQQYRFQKYPQMLYDLDTSTPQKIVHYTVQNQEEFDAAIAEGWSEQPPNYTEQREEYLKPAYAAEASQVQEQIEQVKKRGPGRPRFVRAT